MIGAISTALSGMTAASRKVDEAATSIANAGIDGTPPAENGYIDEIVSIKTAETAFKANAAVIRTSDEMQDRLLDILA